MRFKLFKHWRWACAGLALGLVYSFWHGWVGPEGTLNERTTLDSTEFEQLLVKKSASGQPLITDIRYYGHVEGTDWLIAQQLAHSKKKTSETYIPVKIGATRPYVAKLNPPPKAGPNFTVVDYVKSVRGINPAVSFSTRWWDQEPLRSPLFALVGMMVLGLAGPALSNLLGLSAAMGRADQKTADQKEGYDLSRFGKGKPEATQPVKRGPSKAELDHLRELEAELERKLSGKDDTIDTSADTPEPPQSDAASSPSQAASQHAPVRKLEAGPLEGPAVQDKPKQSKQFGGEYYPTETHVKRDEH
jgi:hypothetical protein